MTSLCHDELEREHHLHLFPESDKIVYQLLNGILEQVVVVVAEWGAIILMEGMLCMSASYPKSKAHMTISLPQF